MDSALHGSLRSFKLPDILTFLNLSHKTGRLQVSMKSRTTQIYLDSGAIVFASSSQKKFRLRQLLLKKKRIDPLQAKQIEADMLEQGEKFGRIAVERKLLTEDELRSYLKIQVSEILYDAFLWDEGSFNYFEDAPLPEYAVTISMDLTNLIMEGARRIDEWDSCRRLLPDPGVVFRVVAAPEIQERITLTLEEWRILFLVDGRRSLAEICEKSEDEALEVYRVLYGLCANKLIETLPKEEESSKDGESLANALLQLERDAHRQDSDDVVTGAFEDDTGLLVSPEANLTYRDILRLTMSSLTVKSEDGDKVIPLVEQEYLIGRTASSHICIPDPSVSSIHARIYRSPDGYVVEDLNSRNGTYVNKERIQRSVLRENDSIRVGSSELIYNIVYDLNAPEEDASKP